MKAEINGVKIHYQLSGKKSAPVILLSHCLASSMIMWQPQIKTLEEEFQVIQYDMRGHGESDTPKGPYTLEVLVDDVIGLLDELRMEMVHFIGLSLGGMIGQGLGVRRPDRLLSLVLSNTSSQTPLEAHPLIQKRIDESTEKGMASQVEETMARWFSQDFLKSGRPEVEMIRKQILETSVEGFCGCLEAIRELNYYQLLSGISVPTLVMVGEDDPGAPVAASVLIHEQIQSSKLVVIPNALHLSNIEQHRTFNNALVQFLRQV